MIFHLHFDSNAYSRSEKKNHQNLNFFCFLIKPAKKEKSNWFWNFYDAAAADASRYPKKISTELQKFVFVINSPTILLFFFAKISTNLHDHKDRSLTDNSYPRHHDDADGLICVVVMATHSSSGDFLDTSFKILNFMNMIIVESSTSKHYGNCNRIRTCFTNHNFLS